MADNVLITAGKDTSVATDDVSGQHYQYVKLADGTADSAAVIKGDATNGLDVDVTRVTGTVTVSGPLTDTQLRATAVPVSISDEITVTLDSESVAVTNSDMASCKTALEIIDDWDDANHCNIRHLNTTDDAVVIADGGNTITVDGTVAVTNADIASIKTAVEIMDDWDSSDHCNIRHLNSTDDIVQHGNRTGRYQLQHEDSAAVTNHEVKAATGDANTAIYIVSVVYNTAIAGTMKLLDGSGGTTLVSMPGLAANGGCSMFFGDCPIKLTNNTALCATTTGAGNWSLTVTGYVA